jgi:hypothetical protein
LPGKEIEEALVTLGGYNVKHAGRSVPSGSWTTTFIEGTDLSVVQRVYDWSEIAHNQRSGVNGESADYKRVARMTMLNNAKGDARTRRIIGIWPQNLTDVAFDTSTSDPSQIEVTWAFDFYEDE